MNDLADLSRDLNRLLDNLEPLQHAIGKFGKDTALESVERALGNDRSFSGLRRKAKLGAGYDLGNPVVLNLRPAGLWFLADEGRKRSKRIFPRKRGGKQALSTPQGPRAWSTSTPSKGHKTLQRTIDGIEKGIVKAANDGLTDLINKVF